MEYLVTMTTHVPDGTPAEAVDDVRAREAARSRELAAQGHLLSPHPNGPGPASHDNHRMGESNVGQHAGG
jgi:hypothetical protein